MKKIDRVGLIVKPHAPDIDKILKELVRFIEKRGLNCLLEEDAALKLDRSDGIKREDIPDQSDLVVVLGGDGTLLSIAHLAAHKNVPVLGVNLGSLGFLTEVPLDEMYLALESYLDGNDKIVSPRQMLEVLARGQTDYVLNDVVINKGALARMIQCAMWINEKEITVPRSDGLIISTPTGSTAYSLSAGGPIIQPYIPAIIIAPICPHTLSFRPMIISSDSKIKIQILTTGEKSYLTLDGQRGSLMERNEIIKVRNSRFKLSLISSPERNYFDLLQEKLGWG